MKHDTSEQMNQTHETCYRTPPSRPRQRFHTDDKFRLGQLLGIGRVMVRTVPVDTIP